MGTIADDVRRYKPFVDGLRAVAILTVVGSHVGVPGFAGGYVGVDIFFVISGYLIIGQIDADVAAGRFSFLDFAARRALRILPAFLLVMITCLILASTLFLQPDFDVFAHSFLQSALMLANHYFLGHQGYFDTEAIAKPLLHMWSLSVEEQFYLVAPLSIVALCAATRSLSETAARRARYILVVGVAIVSFAACIALSYGDTHNPAFYLMPTRGWEFILGGNAAAAALMLRRCSLRTIDLAALAGVAAIAFAVVTFDATTYYPTFRAAFPVLGATMIIACGIAAPGNVVARALSVTPMVWIGLVSYSWYLWHWPLLSFLRTSLIYSSLPEALAVAALALVLAALTYWFLERPIRAWRRNARPRSLPVVASMVSACVLVGATGYAWSRYEVPRLLPEVTGLKPLAEPQGPLPPITRRGILLGDSHAGAVAAPFTGYAHLYGAALAPLAQVACPPVIGVDVRDRNWRDLSCNLSSSVDFSGVDFLILVARWNHYLGLPLSDRYYPQATLASRQPGDTAPPLGLLRQGLIALVAKARQAGVQRLLLVAPVPEFPVWAPSCAILAARRGTDMCTITRSAADARRAGAVAVLRDVARQFAEVHVVDPIEAFCTASRCSPNDGLTVFYVDTNHLSPTGAERLFQQYRKDFEWAFGAASEAVARKGSSSGPLSPGPAASATLSQPRRGE